MFIKEQFTFYTRDGRVYLARDRLANSSYDRGRPLRKMYPWRRVRVSQGEKKDCRSVTIDGDYVTLSVNEPPRSLSVGAGDEFYGFRVDKAENAKSAEWQPYQILANPCVTHLVGGAGGRSLLEIDRPTAKKLPDKDGLKVYEVELDQYSSVLLSFDPEHGDAVSRSELRYYGIDRKGAQPAIFEKTFRVVEKWGKLPDGSPVPVRFVMTKEHRGQTIATLVREISDPVIGDVPETFFDTSRLPEFKMRFTSTVDQEAEKRRIYERQHHGTPPPSRFSRSAATLIVINAVVVTFLAVVAALWRRRRKAAL